MDQEKEGTDAQASIAPETSQALAAEYDRLNGLYLSKVEYVEKKLNLYVTIMSAAVGLIVISSSVSLELILMVLVLMLVVGVITLIGLVQVDIILIRTVSAIRKIQCYLLKNHKDAVKYLSYDYIEDPHRFASFKRTLLQGLTSGGEKTVVTIGNGIVFSSFTTLLAHSLQVSNWRGLVVVFLSSFFVSCLLHVAYIRLVYRFKRRSPESLDSIS